MIKTGTHILFQEPGGEARRFCGSEVIEVEVERFRVRFLGRVVPLAVGEERTVFFEDGGEFLQQLVTIVEVDAAESAAVLEPHGDAISAESRESYRVSTISAGVRAQIEGAGECVVQDVSQSGLGVVAPVDVEVGETVPIVIELAGDIFTGLAAVMSRRPLREGHVRYGLSVREDEGDLLAGLQLVHEATLRPHCLKRS